MISIVDYGLGNIQAFGNIYKQLGIPWTVTSTAADLRQADHIILPGVGAFDWAMTRLDESGMREELQEAVIGRGRPVLGICVGMQMLARRSDEGILDGLGWIDAEVHRFADLSPGVPASLPHMGWNDVVPRETDGLFRDLGTGSRFYFLHSYFVAPRSEVNILATTDYNGTYASAVRSNNVYGVQFHPEKSHQWGIQLLKNFSEL
jgi:glutamine amidotransferase